jgi:hypothetical protein
MSLDRRLDDELQNAFKREQPSVDFMMRVLERAALAPAPRRSWWKKLASLLEPPRLRPTLGWLAVGAAATLLLAVGGIEYSRMKPVSVDEKTTVATTDSAKPANREASGTPASDNQPQDFAKTAPVPKTKRASSSINRRAANARHQVQELRAQGEAAKETLMLALSIASSTLNDAQRAVHDDGLRP